MCNLKIACVCKASRAGSHAALRSTSWDVTLYSTLKAAEAVANGAIGAGIMRGCGRQLLASGLNLVSYWGLGLPLALVLGLHFGLGVQGLWYGLATTTSVQVRRLLWDLSQPPQPARAAVHFWNSWHHGELACKELDWTAAVCKHRPASCNTLGAAAPCQVSTYTRKCYVNRQ